MTPELHAPRPHILVVDDETLILEVVVEDLERQGYRVTGCTDPQSALRHLLGDDTIDPLMTDIRRPGMNGTVLAERALQARPDLEVMFVTGHAGDAERDIGHRRLLLEPFRFDTMQARLAATLGSRLAARR